MFKLAMTTHHRASLLTQEQHNISLVKLTMVTYHHTRPKTISPVKDLIGQTLPKDLTDLKHPVNLK
jgi:hypothetical protein